MGTGKLPVYLATPSVIWRGTVPLDLRVPAICGYLQNRIAQCTWLAQGGRGRSSWEG